MQRRQLLVSAMALGISGALGQSATAGVAPRSARGGSNYNFYRLDGCDREPYGVLKNFHAVADTVRSQLATMHAQGQRRLIIGIFHRQGPETGTVMDSTGGNLAPQYRKNLADLLAAVKRAGFAEVEVGYTQGWIVGETYYNDPAAAGRLRRAIDETGQQVYYLTQWPLKRSRRCDHVTVAPPTDFGNYIGQGF